MNVTHDYTRSANFTAIEFYFRRKSNVYLLSNQCTVNVRTFAAYVELVHVALDFSQLLHLM